MSATLDAGTVVERFEAGRVQAVADMRSTGEVVQAVLDKLGYGPKVRRERIDLDHVQALVESGGNWPPILVTAPDGHIIDGHHRAVAARRMGRTTIPALVVDVDINSPEARELASKPNNEHGLPLTLAERKSNAEWFIKNTDWSNSRIGTTCGLSDKTIAKLRPRATSDSPKLRTSEPDRAGSEIPNLRGREGVDGKSYPTPSEAAERRQEAARQIEAKPAASDREIAKRTGLSPRTVADVRKRNEAGESPVPRRLRAVPNPEPEQPTEGEKPAVAVGDVVVIVPTEWAAEEACQRSNAGREFGRFMDRFTRWHGKGFDHWSTSVGVHHCPPDLRREAAEQARWMAEWWARLAERLAEPAKPKGVE